MDRMNRIARINADRALSAIASALRAANANAVVPSKNDLLWHEERPAIEHRGLTEAWASRVFLAFCIEINKLESLFHTNQSILTVGANT